MWMDERGPSIKVMNHVQTDRKRGNRGMLELVRLHIPHCVRETVYLNLVNKDRIDWMEEDAETLEANF